MPINRNPSFSDIRRFAAAWTAASAFMGVLLFWRHHPYAAYGVWSASAAVAVSGLLAPPLAKVFYRGWMTLSEGIRFAVTQILLLMIFWGVLTTVALVFKLLGRDVLRLKKSRPARGTYWTEHDPMLDNSSYKHLY